MERPLVVAAVDLMTPPLLLDMYVCVFHVHWREMVGLDDSRRRLQQLKLWAGNDRWKTDCMRFVLLVCWLVSPRE